MKKKQPPFKNRVFKKPPRTLVEEGPQTTEEMASDLDDTESWARKVTEGEDLSDAWNAGLSDAGIYDDDDN